MSVPPVAVVYYLGDPDDQLIKIGTTTDLKHRIGSLAKAHLRRVLLATEPGSYPLERRRHHQFRALHVYGEWYRRAPVLMDLVNELRGQYGILHVGDRELQPYFIAPLVTGRHGVPIG